MSQAVVLATHPSTPATFLDLSLESRVKIYKLVFKKSTIMFDNRGVLEDLGMYYMGASLDILSTNKQVRREAMPVLGDCTVVWFKKDHYMKVVTRAAMNIPKELRSRIRTIYNDTLSQGMHLDLSLFPALKHCVAAHLVLHPSMLHTTQINRLVGEERPNLTKVCNAFGLGNRKELFRKIEARLHKKLAEAGVNFAFEIVLLDMHYSLNNSYNKGIVSNLLTSQILRRLIYHRSSKSTCNLED